MTNLELVAQKGKSADQTLWLLNSMEHMLLAEQCATNDFTKRTLAPPKQKGLLDLLIFKRDMLTHLMQVVLASMEMPEQQRQSLAELKGHEICRSRTKNVAWTGTLRESGRLFFTVLQTVIYGNAIDGGMK